MAEDEHASGEGESTATDVVDRRTLVTFVVRLVVLAALGVSCVLTIGEDRKERREADKRALDPLVDVEPPPKSFVFGDASVVDRETNLEWAREDTTERFAWDAAKAHCASLALDGGGWHLPSRAELLTVLKHWHDPLGGGHDWFWSSDIGVRDGTAWAVGSDSWLNGNPVETKSRARCVRDARSR